MSEYNSSKSHPVIVVGGGLAGLAAATYLARSGHQTTLFEKAHELGGRAITNVYGEFHFNMGPHALYRKGPAEQVLRELGVPYTGQRPANNFSAFYRGEIYSLASNLSSLLHPKWLGPGDFFEITRFFVRLFTARPEKFANISFEEWLEKSISRQAARQTLLLLNRLFTYANAPEIQSADSFIGWGQQAVLNGVLYIDGGWQTLIDGLRRAALAAGVKIVTGQRVESVEGEGVTEGVRLASGELIPAGAVILATGPQEAAQLTRNTALTQWAAQAQPARAACLEIGLKKLPLPRRRLVLGLDAPLYFSVHSAYARLGPTGAAVVHVAKYLRPDDHSLAKDDERELEEFVDKVQPGWRNEMIEKRFLPHMVVYNAIPTAAQGGMAGRIGPDVPGFANLYLAGDWVGPEGLLLDAVLASARRAARLVGSPALIQSDQEEIEGKLGKQPAGSF